MAKILLIDDEDALRGTLAQVLEREQHQVTQAVNGREAMKCFAAGAFDLVITDLVMPDQEGIETIIALRRQQPGLKIIAMSGGGRGKAEDYLHVAARVGAQRTLVKPFTRAALLEAVAALLTAETP